MANEAFALSPISARAAQPSDEDYEAIREAFMETSRGRWFLGEYAKRNRNADTKMVLNAVARIEETLAAQKKPVRDPRFEEALAAIRTALDEARAAASAALHDLSLDENLAPVRKGVRVIREISWRLREIGADGRICDLIDSQVNAVEGASAKITEMDPASALSSAFDLIGQRIAEALGQDETAPPPARKAVLSAPEVAEQASADRAIAATQEEAVASAGQAAHNEALEVSAETAPHTPEAEAVGDASTKVEALDATIDGADEIFEPVDALDARDEAMLDIVAAEMGAPDSDEAYTPPEFKTYRSETDDGQARDGEDSDPELAQGVVARAAESRVAPVVRPPEPSSGPSLGSSLLARGIVQRPRALKPDPLAPIRRMSQTEKIAFFS